MLLSFEGSFAAPFESQQFAISVVSPHAVEAAEKTYASGGNLIDAAVASALTLAVTNPYFAALGGGGFALIHYSGKTYALDFRETAPAATHKAYYLSKDPKAPADGGAAVGVPGMVAGLWALHKKFGKKPWKGLFTEALKLADKGFAVSGEWYSYTTRAKPRLVVGQNAILIKNEVPKPGETLTQKKLADALHKIQVSGPKGFYEGAIASDIIRSVKKAGGELSLEDLKSYQVQWREPIKTSYKGHEILMMPPPSSAAVVMGAAFQMFDRQNLSSLSPGSSKELHLIAETLKRSFRGRYLLGDPKFVDNPVDQLLSPKYIEAQLASIRTDKAGTVSMADLKEVKESQETTHFSLMDREGNALAITVTLNGNYGSGVVTENYGIVLNNEMDDFTARPGEPNQFGLVQGEANQVEAGKRPLSSMSPTLVFKDGKVVASLGSPGGPRIISAVVQVIHRLLGNNMDMDQAIQFVRVHNQILPNKTYIDPLRSSEDTRKRLTDMGHIVEEDTVAKVYGVRRNSKGWFEAAHDSRGEGASGGL